MSLHFSNFNSNGSSEIFVLDHNFLSLVDYFLIYYMDLFYRKVFLSEKYFKKNGLKDFLMIALFCKDILIIPVCLV
jgi:hypothetical protein